MAKKKYMVKHNFMFNGQFTEVGSILEAEPNAVRYLVLGGQLEEQATTKKESAEETASKKTPKSSK